MACELKKLILLLQAENVYINTSYNNVYEKDIPTIKQKESKQTWFSLQNGYGKRSSRFSQSTCKRS